jgi:hypothetical protein
MTGVLRMYTPSPSVLPTHTVSDSSGCGVAVGCGAGVAVGGAGARVEVAATVGATVGAGVDVGGEAPPMTPHPLRSNAMLPQTNPLRHRI